MAQLLDPFRTRLFAVWTGGRGADGSLGADALARSIPAGFFRPTQAPLTSAGFPAQAFDRGMWLAWVSTGDYETDTRMSDFAERTFLLDVRVGYVAADGIKELVHLLPGTSETTADAVLYARERALSDAERIDRATWHELVTGSLDANDQAIIEVTRGKGPSAIDETPDGRLICTTRFAVRAWVKVTASNLP